MAACAFIEIGNGFAFQEEQGVHAPDCEYFVLDSQEWLDLQMVVQAHKETVSRDGFESADAFTSLALVVSVALAAWRINA